MEWLKSKALQFLAVLAVLLGAVAYWQYTSAVQAKVEVKHLGVQVREQAAQSKAVRTEQAKSTATKARTQREQRDAREELEKEKEDAEVDPTDAVRSTPVQRLRNLAEAQQRIIDGVRTAE